jgi:hypothetical protein
MDCQLADDRLDRKLVTKGLVKGTWKGLLKDEGDLPEDWVGTNSGVLVGMDLKSRDWRTPDPTIPIEPYT